MLLRGFRLFGVALHREPKGTKRELAVELGNPQIVRSLLQARASVSPIQEALPPLLLAVLHRHHANVKLLLEAQADPWESVPVRHLHRYTMQGHMRAARSEAFTIVQAAAVQDADDTVLDLLLKDVPSPSNDNSKPSGAASTTVSALSDRATAIVKQVVWTFQHVIAKQDG